MPRFDEITISRIPAMPDYPGWRHFGDGLAGPIIAVRLQAYNPTALAYQDLLIDNATGALVSSGGGAGGSVKPGTGTETSVADNAASVTLLAANANRLGASITNDSSGRLYIRAAAAAASLTTYTVSLAQHDHWEVPFGYTGEIRGIWATDPNDGAARITEYTA